MCCGDSKRDSSTFTCFLRAFLTHCLTQSLARCLFNVVTRRPRARLKKEELSGSAPGTQSASYLPAVPSFSSPSSQVLGQMEIPSRTFDPELPPSTFPFLKTPRSCEINGHSIRASSLEKHVYLKISTLDTIEVKTKNFKIKKRKASSIQEFNYPQSLHVYIWGRKWKTNWRNLWNTGIG